MDDDADIYADFDYAIIAESAEAAPEGCSLTELRTQLDEASAENARLRGEVAVLREKDEKATAQLALLSKHLTALLITARSEVGEQAAQNKRLRQEITRLRLMSRGGQQPCGIEGTLQEPEAEGRRKADRTPRQEGRVNKFARQLAGYDSTPAEEDKDETPGTDGKLQPTEDLGKRHPVKDSSSDVRSGCRIGVSAGERKPRLSRESSPGRKGDGSNSEGSPERSKHLHPSDLSSRGREPHDSKVSVKNKDLQSRDSSPSVVRDRHSSGCSSEVSEKAYSDDKFPRARRKQESSEGSPTGSKERHLGEHFQSRHRELSGEHSSEQSSKLRGSESPRRRCRDGDCGEHFPARSEELSSREYPVDRGRGDCNRDPSPRGRDLHYAEHSSRRNRECRPDQRFPERSEELLSRECSPSGYREHHSSDRSPRSRSLHSREHTHSRSSELSPQRKEVSPHGHSPQRDRERCRETSRKDGGRTSKIRSADRSRDWSPEYFPRESERRRQPGGRQSEYPPRKTEEGDRMHTPTRSRDRRGDFSHQRGREQFAKDSSARYDDREQLAEDSSAKYDSREPRFSRGHAPGGNLEYERERKYEKHGSTERRDRYGQLRVRDTQKYESEPKPSGKRREVREDDGSSSRRKIVSGRDEGSWDRRLDSSERRGPRADLPRGEGDLRKLLRSRDRDVEGRRLLSKKELVNPVLRERERDTESKTGSENDSRFKDIDDESLTKNRRKTERSSAEGRCRNTTDEREDWHTAGGLPDAREKPDASKEQSNTGSPNSRKHSQKNSADEAGQNCPAEARDGSSGMTVDEQVDEQVDEPMETEVPSERDLEHLQISTQSTSGETLEFSHTSKREEEEVELGCKGEKKTCSGNLDVEGGICVFPEVAHSAGNDSDELTGLDKVDEDLPKYLPLNEVNLHSDESLLGWKKTLEDMLEQEASVDLSEENGTAPENVPVALEGRDTEISSCYSTKGTDDGFLVASDTERPSGSVHSTIKIERSCDLSPDNTDLELQEMENKPVVEGRLGNVCEAVALHPESGSEVGDGPVLHLKSETWPEDAYTLLLLDSLDAQEDSSSNLGAEMKTECTDEGAKVMSSEAFPPAGVVSPAKTFSSWENTSEVLGKLEEKPKSPSRGILGEPTNSEVVSVSSEPSADAGSPLTRPGVQQLPKLDSEDALMRRGRESKPETVGILQATSNEDLSAKVFLDESLEVLEASPTPVAAWTLSDGKKQEEAEQKLAVPSLEVKDSLVSASFSVEPGPPPVGNEASALQRQNSEEMLSQTDGGAHSQTEVGSKCREERRKGVTAAASSPAQEASPSPETQSSGCGKVGQHRPKQMKGSPSTKLHVNLGNSTSVSSPSEAISDAEACLLWPSELQSVDRTREKDTESALCGQSITDEKRNQGLTLASQTARELESGANMKHTHLLDEGFSSKQDDDKNAEKEEEGIQENSPSATPLLVGRENPARASSSLADSACAVPPAYSSLKDDLALSSDEASEESENSSDDLCEDHLDHTEKNTTCSGEQFPSSRNNYNSNMNEEEPSEGNSAEQSTDPLKPLDVSSISDENSMSLGEEAAENSSDFEEGISEQTSSTPKKQSCHYDAALFKRSSGNDLPEDEPSRGQDCGCKEDDSSSDKTGSFHLTGSNSDRQDFENPTEERKCSEEEEKGSERKGLKDGEKEEWELENGDIGGDEDDEGGVCSEREDGGGSGRDNGDKVLQLGIPEWWLSKVKLEEGGKELKGGKPKERSALEMQKELPTKEEEEEEEGEDDAFEEVLQELGMEEVEEQGPEPEVKTGGEEWQWERKRETMMEEEKDEHGVMATGDACGVETDAAQGPSLDAKPHSVSSIQSLVEADLLKLERLGECMPPSSLKDTRLDSSKTSSEKSLSDSSRSLLSSIDSSPHPSGERTIVCESSHSESDASNSGLTFPSPLKRKLQFMCSPLKKDETFEDKKRRGISKLVLPSETLPSLLEKVKRAMLNSPEEDGKSCHKLEGRSPSFEVPHPRCSEQFSPPSKKIKAEKRPQHPPRRKVAERGLPNRHEDVSDSPLMITETATSSRKGTERYQVEKEKTAVQQTPAAPTGSNSSLEEGEILSEEEDGDIKDAKETKAANQREACPDGLKKLTKWSVTPSSKDDQGHVVPRRAQKLSEGFYLPDPSPDRRDLKRPPEEKVLEKWSRRTSQVQRSTRDNGGVVGQYHRSANVSNMGKNRDDATNERYRKSRPHSSSSYSISVPPGAEAPGAERGLLSRRPSGERGVGRKQGKRLETSTFCGDRNRTSDASYKGNPSFGKSIQGQDDRQFGYGSRNVPEVRGRPGVPDSAPGSRKATQGRGPSSLQDPAGLQEAHSARGKVKNPEALADKTSPSSLKSASDQRSQGDGASARGLNRSVSLPSGRGEESRRVRDKLSSQVSGIIKLGPSGQGLPPWCSAFLPGENSQKRKRSLDLSPGPPLGKRRCSEGQS